MNSSPLDHEENLKKAERIAYLIAGHLRNTLAPAEQDELDDWITESDENLELFETLTDEDNIEMAMQRYLAIEREKAAALAGVKEQVGLLAKKRPVNRLLLPLTAASLILAAAGLYFFTRPSAHPLTEKPIAQTTGAVQAGTNKAVLTLSDGRTLILDSSRSGQLANEGAIAIQGKGAGELVYTGTKNETRYNLLTTPRGGQYKVVLGDGTQVWLNAESALRFPAGFAPHQRVVELRGEAYFEVAKDISKPFTVVFATAKGDSGRVVVLGTHFNVNTYSDEGVVKTTLLEGAVRVAKGSNTKRLQPGEQALIADGISVVNTNVAEVVAWKEGRFLFRDATVRVIGEQIKRWYDIEVEYQGNVNQHFNTEARRNGPLTTLLDGLEGTGQVAFVLTGRKLIIKPKQQTH